VAKVEEIQAIASAQRLAREAADSDDDSDYKPTPKELQLNQELHSSSSSEEEEEEEDEEDKEQEEDEAKDEMQVDWTQEQADMGISPSEPPTKKAKLSTAAAKRKELETKSKPVAGRGLADDAMQGAGGGRAAEPRREATGGYVTYLGPMSEKIKEYMPKVNRDYSLVPSHMADEHRLRPGIAPKYDHFSREQLVAEMTALGWKVKAKTTKKEMQDHLGKTWGAWRFRVK
jgi:hypothetical protein